MAKKLILIAFVAIAVLTFEGVRPRTVKQDILSYSRESVRAMTGGDLNSHWGV